jgi:hypothetical protein
MMRKRTVIAALFAFSALTGIAQTPAQAAGPATAAAEPKIIGGTTTITFTDAWLQTLSNAGYGVRGVGGASFAKRKQGDREVVTLRIPVVRAASNTFVLASFQGQSLQVKHRGGLRLTAPNGKTVTFGAIELIASRPASQNRMTAVVPEGTVRDAQTFVQLTTMTRLTRPRGGVVKVGFGTARFLMPGGTGFDWDSQGGTFPASASGMVLGTISSTLRVR